MSTAPSPFLPDKSMIISDTASVETVSRMVDQYIGANDFSSSIALRFRGRYRSIATLIRVFISSCRTGAGIDIQRDIDIAVSEISSKFDTIIVELSEKLMRHGLVQHHILNMLADMTLAFVYTGRSVSMIMKPSEGHILDLISAGITILDRTTGSECKYKMKISEPLMAKAIMDSTLVQPQSVPTQMNSSNLGFYSETLFSKTLCQWLSDWRNLCDIPGLQVPIQLVGKEIRLQKDERVEKIHDGSFLTWSQQERAICHPENWLGPDSVFSLEVRNLGNTEFALLPCVAQYKLRKSVTLPQCMASLERENFGKGKSNVLPQKREETVTALRTFLGPQYLKLVLVWPALVTSDQPTRISERNSNPFHLAISGEMMLSVFSQEDRDFLQAAKEYCDRVDHSKVMNFE
jgi:hypothetical protein